MLASESGGPGSSPGPVPIHEVEWKSLERISQLQGGEEERVEGREGGNSNMNAAKCSAQFFILRFFSVVVTENFVAAAK